MRNVLTICVTALVALLSPGISRAEAELMRFRARADADGDGRTDPALYAPVSGAWVAWSSETRARTPVAVMPRGGRPLTGDFDGDGLTDRAVLQPWQGLTLQRSSAGTTNYPLRLPGALPVSGDLDHDGIDDPGVYHPPSGQWWWWLSSGSTTQFQFGYPGTVPVVGDFDGDGISDPGVYDPQRGLWFMRQSRDGIGARQLGYPGVQPVVGDFNGDGRDDPGIYDPARRGWYLAGPRGGLFSVSFGENGALAAVGDVDNDAFADLLLYQPRTGTWSIRGSRTGLTTVRLGLPGGVPAVSATLAPARARRMILNHREAVIRLDNGLDEPTELRGGGSGLAITNSETVQILEPPGIFFQRTTVADSQSISNRWLCNIAHLTINYDYNGLLPNLEFAGASRMLDRLIVLGSVESTELSLDYYVYEITIGWAPQVITSSWEVALAGMPIEEWDTVMEIGAREEPFYGENRNVTRFITPGRPFLVELSPQVTGWIGPFADPFYGRTFSYSLTLTLDP
jgi:hypothetical protein